MWATREYSRFSCHTHTTATIIPFLSPPVSLKILAVGQEDSVQDILHDIWMWWLISNGVLEWHSQTNSITHTSYGDWRADKEPSLSAPGLARHRSGTLYILHTYPVIFLMISKTWPQRGCRRFIPEIYSSLLFRQISSVVLRILFSSQVWATILTGFI